MYFTAAFTPGQGVTDGLVYELRLDEGQGSLLRERALQQHSTLSYGSWSYVPNPRLSQLGSSALAQNVFCNGGYRFGFNGMHRDDEIAGHGNSLDFGARMYDSRLGRWMSVDPLFKEFVSFSPYIFAFNTPLQAKDPDGNLVIFINGQHTGNGGTAKYWEGYDQKVMAKLDDNSARYVDGAMGGFRNTLGVARAGAEMSLTTGYAPAGALFTAVLSATNASNLSLEVRKEAGKAQGLADAAEIYASLGEGETVKIVTHSMGTAFSRGYVDGLNQWAKENGKTINIEFQLDVNAFQGNELPPSEGVPTYNKTGGLDGLKLGGLLKYGPTGSVFSVSPVPVKEGFDLSSKSDQSKGHAIKSMSTYGIPKLGNNGNRSSRPVEQGSNNRNATR